MSNNTSILGNDIWAHDMGGSYIVSSTGTDTITLGPPMTSGGYVYTTTTTGPSLAWGTESIIPDNITGGALEVKGDANFQGEVRLKGKNLSDTLQAIEDRLAILHPNPKLEEKWEKLKTLGKMYRELEQEIIEKEKMWDILKK